MGTGSKSMLWAIAMIVVATGTVLAEVRTSPLRGEVLVAGKTLVDPPPGEPKDTHAFVTITGPSALRMYRTMKAPERADACLEGKIKEAGPLTCSLDKNGRSASCSFSIDLLRGALDEGRPC